MSNGLEVGVSAVDGCTDLRLDVLHKERRNGSNGVQTEDVKMLGTRVVVHQ